MHKKKKEGEREQEPLLAFFLLPSLGGNVGKQRRKKRGKGGKRRSKKRSKHGRE